MSGILPTVEGDNWWLLSPVPIRVIDRNAFFDFSVANGPVPDPLLPRAEPTIAAAKPFSDSFIVREYGLRAEVVPFASNYYVAAVDQDGARTLCEHNHRTERYALACAEKTLAALIKTLRVEMARKKNVQLKHIPKQRKFKFPT